MKRLKKLQDELKNKGYNAIILTDPISQKYITGIDFEDGYVILTLNKTYVFADFRYIEIVNKTADSTINVVLYDGKKESLLPVLQENSIVTLLYEDNTMTCREFESLKKVLQRIEFIPAGDLITNMQEYKDEVELNNIIKAQEITDKAFSKILNVINPNMTEIELAAELEYYMRKFGAQGTSFSTIAIGGKKTSMPHGVPSCDKLVNNCFVTMDFGCVVNGYCSDMTRTVVLGKADADMKKLYSTVLKAQMAGISALKIGDSCQKIDKVARDIIYAEGYKNCFGHSLGHGVGTHIHEMPRLSPSSKPNETLQIGHVVTIEPGIYIENKYGCRIEDMAYISKDGAIDLTKSPKELIEI